jgi:hypothetical protein
VYWGFGNVARYSATITMKRIVGIVRLAIQPLLGVVTRGLWTGRIDGTR